MGVVCLAGFALGSHAFFRWLAAQVAPEGRPWPARWSAAMVTTVVVMFIAGISAAGVAHQVGWLLGSPELLAEGSMRPIARRAQSTNNLKQIGLGLHSYQREHGTFPPGGTFAPDGRALHGWQACILPFLERGELHDRINFDLPWDDPANEAAFREPLPMFLYPGREEVRDAKGYALSHYAGNVRVLGGEVARSLDDLTDGASHTILAGEAAGRFRPWGDPANWRDPALGINRTPGGFGSPFPGGANLLFADGAVRFVRDGADPRVLRALSTPDGGEAAEIGD